MSRLEVYPEGITPVPTEEPQAKDRPIELAPEGSGIGLEPIEEPVEEPVEQAEVGTSAKIEAELEPVPLYDESQYRFPSPPPFPADDWQPQQTYFAEDLTPNEVKRAQERKAALERLHVYDFIDEDKLKDVSRHEGAFLPRVVRPRQIYNIVVLGATPEGIEAALHARSLGASVAIVTSIDEHAAPIESTDIARLTLGACAARMKELQDCHNLGLCSAPKANWGKIRNRMYRTFELVHPDHSLKAAREFGVDIFAADNPRFHDDRSLQVGPHRVGFHRCIMTSRPQFDVPKVTNLDYVGYLFENQLSQLQCIPDRTIVIGRTAAAVEIAQSLAIFGSNVTLLSQAPLTPHFDHPLIENIRECLKSAGVTFYEESAILTAEIDPETGVRTVFIPDHRIDCEQIILCPDHRPNFDSMQINRAKLKADDQGRIQVDRQLKTRNARIYAVGESAACDATLSSVVYRQQSLAQARLAVTNSLGAADSAQTFRPAPRVIHTVPKIAQVGPANMLGESHRSGLKRFTMCSQGTSFSLVADKHGQIFSASGHGKGTDMQMHVFALALANKLTLRGLASSHSGHPGPGTMIRDTVIGAREDIKFSNIEKEESKKRKRFTRKLEKKKEKSQTQPESSGTQPPPAPAEPAQPSEDAETTSA